jgi:hypothetical protein
MIDSSFYNNTFQLKALANKDESAIDKYTNFATWEFKI